MSKNNYRPFQSEHSALPPFLLVPVAFYLILDRSRGNEGREANPNTATCKKTYSSITILLV